MANKDTAENAPMMTTCFSVSWSKSIQSPYFDKYGAPMAALNKSICFHRIYA